MYFKSLNKMHWYKSTEVKSITTNASLCKGGRLIKIMNAQTSMPLEILFSVMVLDHYSLCVSVWGGN